MKETIIADGTSHEVETKPLTLIHHSADVRTIEVPNRTEINPQKTLECADNLKQEDWDGLRTCPDFLKLFNIVFPDLVPNAILKDDGMDVRHMVGMLVMIAQCHAEGKQPFIKYPEAFMRPSNQVNLAELFVFFFRKATNDLFHF